MANKYDKTNYSAYAYAEPFSASPIPADGMAKVTTTLTVLGSSGPGVAQRLQYQAWSGWVSSSESGTAATGAIVTGPAATDGAGKATLTLTATKPGHYQIQTTNTSTPGDVYYSSGVAGTVTFVQPSYKDKTAYSAYSYGAFDSGKVPADGVSPVTTTLTVSGTTSSFGKNKPIQAIAWSGWVTGSAAAPGAAVTDAIVTAAAGATNESGQISFTITANAPGQYQIKATNTVDHEDYYSDPTALFLPPSLGSLDVVATLPGYQLADQRTPIPIQLTVKNHDKSTPLTGGTATLVVTSNPLGLARFSDTKTATTLGTISSDGTISTELAPLTRGANVSITVSIPDYIAGTTKTLAIISVPAMSIAPALLENTIDDNAVNLAKNSHPQGIQIQIPNYGTVARPIEISDTIDVYADDIKISHIDIDKELTSPAKWPYSIYIDYNAFNFKGPVEIKYTINKPANNPITSESLILIVNRSEITTPNTAGGTLPAPSYGTKLYNPNSTIIDDQGYIYNKGFYDANSSLSIIIPNYKNMKDGDKLNIKFLLAGLTSTNRGTLLTLTWPDLPPIPYPVTNDDVMKAATNGGFEINLPFDPFLKNGFDNADTHLGPIIYEVLRVGVKKYERSKPLSFEVDVVQP